MLSTTWFDRTGRLNPSAVGSSFRVSVPVAPDMQAGSVELVTVTGTSSVTASVVVTLNARALGPTWNVTDSVGGAFALNAASAAWNAAVAVLRHAAAPG